MTKNTKLVVVAVALLFAVIIGVRWLRPKPVPGSHKIGAIVFLTGPQASLGEEVKNALTLGLEEINDKGGIKGGKLDIIFEDSKDSPRDAILGFNRLETEKCPVIISTGDVVSLNLGPIVDEKQIPMIATVAAGPDITKRSGWVFRVFIQATRQAQVMAEYAGKSLGVKSAAILAINNEFGQTTSATFKNVLESHDARITGTETFGVADRDVRAQITKLKGGNPAAIYVTGFGDGYGAAIKQVRELKFTGLLLSDATLSIPFFQQQTTPASEGAYFSATLFDEDSQAPVAANFIKGYRQKFGSPPGFVAAFAYDALKLTAAAIEKGGDAPEGIRNALRSTKNFEGVVGRVSFTESGDLDFPLVLKRLQNGKPVIVWQGE